MRLATTLLAFVMAVSATTFAVPITAQQSGYTQPNGSNWTFNFEATRNAQGLPIVRSITYDGVHDFTGADGADLLAATSRNGVIVTLVHNVRTGTTSGNYQDVAAVQGPEYASFRHTAATDLAQGHGITGTNQKGDVIVVTLIGKDAAGNYTALSKDQGFAGLGK